MNGKFVTRCWGGAGSLGWFPTGYRVPAGDENVVAMDSGDGCTAV